MVLVRLSKRSKEGKFGFEYFFYYRQVPYSVAAYGDTLCFRLDAGVSSPAVTWSEKLLLHPTLITLERYLQYLRLLLYEYDYFKERGCTFRTVSRRVQYIPGTHTNSISPQMENISAKQNQDTHIRTRSKAGRTNSDIRIRSKAGHVDSIRMK